MSEFIKSIEDLPEAYREMAERNGLLELERTLEEEETNGLDILKAEARLQREIEKLERGLNIEGGDRRRGDSDLFRDHADTKTRLRDAKERLAEVENDIRVCKKSTSAHLKRLQWLIGTSAVASLTVFALLLIQLFS